MAVPQALGAAKGPAKKKGKKKERALSVSVITPALTQTKDVPLAEALECDELSELLSLLSEYFPAVLRDPKRTARMLLFCRADGAPDGWLLVTRESELADVFTCPALKLTERPRDREFREAE